jgi:MinD-like ATPase involved in chromosome partitioning or flagellar assembly
VEEVDFADGFDIAEPLLWGLTPAQVMTIAAGVALGYLALRSPIPHAAGIAIAVSLAGCALALATLRVEGRTLLSWLGAAARFQVRPRSGLIVVHGGARDAAAPESATAVAESSRAAAVSAVIALEAEPALSRRDETRAHRLAFFSLAGGSGRSTLAVEVAALLADGRGATLLDLDLLSPRASIRLGVPLACDWQGLLDPRAEPIVATHAKGLRVVPGPAGTGDGRFVDDPQLPACLEALLRAVELACETVVLDIPAGLGGVARWAIDVADVVVVVLTPTAGGVQDVYRSTEALRRLGHARKLRYAVNRSQDASLFAEAMADLRGTVLGCVPEDPALTSAEVEHRLVAAGDGPTATSLRALAARLAPPAAAQAGPALRVAPLLEASRRRERRAG